MKLGEAFIEIMPTLDSSAQRAMQTQASRMGQRVGEQLGEGIVRGADGKLRDSRGRFVKSGEDAGSGFSSGFTKALNKDVNNKASVFGHTLAVMGAKATIAGAGVASATPAILQMTAALVPATGAALALPGAMLAISVASATVKLAVLGVGDAIEEGFTGSAEDAAAALKKLPPEARTFAKSVIGLKGDLESLRTVVSNRFFDPINASFEPFVNRYLPVAEQKLPRISQAIGATAGEFAKAATNASMFKAVNSLLDNTALSIALANENMGTMTTAIGNVVKVGADALPRMASGFNDITVKVSEFINKAAETGKLKLWLDDGINTLNTLGSITSNVGSILWSVLQGANQRGASLLQTLDDITEQIADFLNSAKGIEGLNAAFSTMSAIGQGLRTGLGAALPAIAQSVAIAGPSVAELAGVFGQLVVAVAPLLPYFTGITVQVLKFLMPAIQRLSNFLAEHENVVKAIVIAYVAYLAAAKAQAAIIAVQAAGGLVAYIKGLKLVQVATKAWAAVQWLLNAALTANPIGIVIVAVAALIAAIVLLWNKNETFRKIVLAVWAAIKVAIKAVADWFTGTVWPAIKVALKWLGDAFSWLYKNIIKPVWNGIKAAIGFAWSGIQFYWNALKAYINLLGDIFMWLWRKIINPVWQGIKLAIQIAWVAIQIIFKTGQIAIKILAAAFTWLWKNVITPVWNAIRTIINTVWSWLVNNIFNPAIKFIRGVLSAAWTFYSNLIKTVWNAIKNAVSTAWAWVRDKVLNPLRNFITGALAASWNNAKNLIISAWNAIKSPISATWNWIVNNVFNPLRNFITKTIPSAFSTGVSAVRTAWNKIQDAAKVPVKFVVNTVINGGIIKGFNWIANKVGVTPITPISLGFHDGGVLPGYTPGRDVHRFVGPAGTLDMSGGEAIMRPEFTRAVGPDFVNRANKTAKQSGIGGIRKLMRDEMGARFAFKDGGVWGGIKSFTGNIVGGIKTAWNALTNPVDTFKGFIKGMVNNIPGGPFLRDTLRNTVGKMVDGVGNWISSKFSAFGGSFGNWPASPAAQRGDSGVWRRIVQLINSTGPLSGAFGNGYRHGDPLWHGSGRAVDWMGYNQDALANFLAARKPLELIHRTSQRDYAYTRGRNMGSFDNALMEAHRNHIHIAMRHGGIFRYDQGGWFNPGQVGINRLNKPEAVLTPEESAGLKAMGTDKLVDLLEDLIEAVREVAPGVGGYIRGSGRGLITKARQA